MKIKLKNEQLSNKIEENCFYIGLERVGENIVVKVDHAAILEFSICEETEKLMANLISLEKVELDYLKEKGLKTQSVQDFCDQLLESDEDSVNIENNLRNVVRNFH